MPNLAPTITLDEILENQIDPRMAIQVVKGYFQERRLKEESGISLYPTKPEEMWVMCMDSRLTPPQDVYCIRNPGGAIPHASAGSLALEFEAAAAYCLNKGIRTVILNGHGLCGAIKADVDGNPPIHLARWLSAIKNPQRIATLPVDSEAASKNAHLRENYSFAYQAVLRASEVIAQRDSYKNAKSYAHLKETLKAGHVSVLRTLTDIGHQEFRITYGGAHDNHACSHIIQQYEHQRRKAYDPTHGRMHDLIANDQHPFGTFISGISAGTRKYQMGLGDVFNATWSGGYIPPYRGVENATTLAGVLEFSLLKKVPTIAVAGHRYNLLEDYIAGSLPEKTKEWLDYCLPTLASLASRGVNIREIEEECLRASYHHLLQYPGISDAVNQGTLSVLFTLENYRSGTLEYLESQDKAFKSIQRPELSAA